MRFSVGIAKLSSIIIFLSSASAIYGKKPETAADSLHRALSEAIKSDDNRRIIRTSARILASDGISKSMEKECLLYSGLAYGLEKQIDSSDLYLNKAYALVHGQDPWGEATYWNHKGLVALNAEADYYKAINCFSNGIKAARMIPAGTIYPVLLANISLVYGYKRDTTGISYAMECYNYGKNKDNAFTKYIGSWSMASFCHMLHRYDEALSYIQDAYGIVFGDPVNGISVKDKIQVSNLYGKILAETGRLDEASAHFSYALEQGSENTECDLPDIFLSYGQYYLQTGDYDSAIGMFRTGIDSSLSSGNHVHLYELYESLSYAYESEKHVVEALKYCRKAHEQRITGFDIDKERALSELKVKYDLGQKENELALKQIQLLRQRKANIIFIMLAAIFMLLCIVIWYINHSRSGYYLSIVKQNQEALQAKERLDHIQNENPSGRCAGLPPHGKYAFSALSDSKGRMLFNQVEKLLNEKRIYRDPRLSADKLAELCSTNRSYLSRVINEYSGQNFSSYINRYRINEAIAILSDTENIIPLKAISSECGFLTVNTFYSYFKKEVGVPPAKYREKLLVLKKNGAGFKSQPRR